MKRAILTTWMVTALAGPAFAWHGDATSTRRDAWIDESLVRVSAAGLLPDLAEGTRQLSNLEVAELTARASERLMVQSTLSEQSESKGAGQITTAKASDKPASQDMQKLVQEFRVELQGMSVDVAELEKRVGMLEDGMKGFEARREEAAKGTGTDLNAYGRGWIVTDRGLGPDRTEAPLSRQACQFVEVRMKSVPVPSLLFDLRLRMWASFGKVYEEPIPQTLEVHKVALAAVTDPASVQLGDYYKDYTPLTLFNDDPWHLALKPGYYRQLFADIEDLTLTDGGPAWHLRGVNVRTKEDWPGLPVVRSATLDVLAGRLEEAGLKPADYYAGGQADLKISDDRLGIRGTGLLLWDNPEESGMAYNPDSVITWTQKYRVLSVEPRAKTDLPGGSTFDASFELAGSRYQDDTRNPDRVLEDWASRLAAGLASHGVSLYGKALDVGPHFYSPGAQTLRRTPGKAAGYIGTDQYRDFAVIGSRSGSLFQGVGRPFFAPYDRVSDNLFPYGDATPNRKAYGGGLSARVGKDGWFHPGVSYTTAEELKPNVVLVGGPSPTLSAVDSQENTAVARTRDFGQLEGVVQADIAKMAGWKDPLALGFDYRNQRTRLATTSDAMDLKTDVWMVTADFVLPMSGFRSFEWSVFYGEWKAKGREFFDLDGLAAYPFLADPSMLGTYSARDVDQKESRWACQLKCPLNENAALRGSVFKSRLKPAGLDGYDSRRLEWRIGYEASI